MTCLRSNPSLADVRSTAASRIPDSDVLLMPEGTTRDELDARRNEVSELAMEYGYRYTPRLHVDLWNDAPKRNMTRTHSQFATGEGRIKHRLREGTAGVRLPLEAVGEDPDSNALTETWQRRVPDAFATLTEGQREAAKPTMRTFDAETTDLVVKTAPRVFAV